MSNKPQLEVSLFDQSLQSIDNMLAETSLPPIASIVKGGYGQLSLLAAQVLHQRNKLLIQVSEQPVDTQDIIYYFRRKIDEVANAISMGYPEISEPLIDTSHPLHQHACAFAERFLIDDDLYQYSEVDSEDPSVIKQLKLLGTPQDQLLNRIYQQLTQRQPNTVSNDFNLEKFYEEIENVIIDIEEHIDQKKYRYELIEEGRNGALQKMAFAGETQLTVEPSDYVFPIQYTNPSLDRQTMRYYFTFKETEAEKVGLHFVRILNILLKSGVRISGSKACSPYAMRHRIESMIILSHPEDNNVIHEVLSEYDKQHNCLDDSFLATPFSLHRGIATAQEPNKVEAMLANTVYMRDAGSFNALYSSMIYYYVLQRLVCSAQGKAQAMYQRELDRITPVFSKNSSTTL